LKRVQSLKLSATIQMLPIVAGYGANLLATPFVVESLGLTNFGLWAVTGAVAQYGVLLDLGVSRALTRFVALYHTQGNEEKERSVIGAAVMVIVSIGCILLCFPALIPSELGNLIGEHDSKLTRVLFFAAITLLITGLLGQMFAAASIGRGRFVAANIGLATQRAAVVVGGVIALIINPKLETFAIGSAAGGSIGLVMVLLSILVDDREVRIGRPSRAVLPDLIAFGIKGQAMSVCEIILFQSGKILAGIIIGPAAAGAYELGRSVQAPRACFRRSSPAHMLRKAWTRSGGITHDWCNETQQ
jgi:O-antigen/teichoic acid export membrane protein